MQINKHETEDWCHLCGARREDTLDVSYPKNAEHGGDDVRYLRICVGCAVRIVMAGCDAPGTQESRSGVDPQDEALDAETSYLVEAAARTAIGERGFAGIGDCLRGVGRAVDAAEDHVACRTGPEGDAERRVYLHASEEIGRCRMTIKDLARR